MDLMKQHREKKNQMDRPHPGWTPWICEEYNRRKSRGRSSKRKAMGQIKKKVLM
jgi:hypothetical protein